MRVIIEPDYEKLSQWAARYIASRLKAHERSGEKRPFVLGLPTGSSPLGTYKELIKLNKSGYISFKNVVTFNMDEYVGLPRDHEQSYYTFMHTNFFDHIDILPENTNLLDGNAPDPEKECQRYEDKIASYGGIDLFMGGIGADGHIAFNEPNTPFGSETHVVDLTENTIKDNARLFSDISEVPRKAFTMGIKQIMQARQILILASGANKADAVYKTVCGKVTEEVPASVLQLHPNCILIADKEAASKL